MLTYIYVFLYIILLTPAAMEYSVKVYWGNTEYYKNGVLHRDGDLPAVVVMYQKTIRDPTRQPSPNRQNTRQSAKTHAPIPQPIVPRNMVHENDV